MEIRGRTTTLEAFPRIAVSAALCSAAIVEYTIPQVVRLSGGVLHPVNFHARWRLLARMLPLQTAITIVQFSAVRELRDVLDSTTGPHPFNISLAYGFASVPLIAGKYNLVTEGVYSAAGKSSMSSSSSPPSTTTMPWQLRARDFWRRKIQPGILWSYLRDSGSIGAGVVLGPVVTTALRAATGQHVNVQDGEDESWARRLAWKFAGGLGAGSITAFFTQWLHNAALTGGRIAEVENRLPGTMECMRRSFQEHGLSLIWVNYRYRVAIIASWTAFLNLTEPFQV